MIRIIAGEFKGRRLKTPAGDAVRPTADRVREAWFSILQRSIRGARVLDLFAGSGALGFEALSRGAVSADFVELHRFALATRKANVKTLKVDDRAAIHRAEPAHDQGGAGGAHEVGQQAVERPDFDPRIRRGFLDQRDALLQREQRLLRHVDGDRDDHAVGEGEGAPDQVFVPPRDRVERAGVDGDARHGA